MVLFRATIIIFFTIVLRLRRLLDYQEDESVLGEICLCSCPCVNTRLTVKSIVRTIGNA